MSGKSAKGSGKTDKPRIKPTGVSKQQAKGPSVDELKSEIKTLKEKLDQCAADNVLLRKHYSKPEKEIGQFTYEGTDIFKDGYERVTEKLKELEAANGSDSFSNEENQAQVNELQSQLREKDSTISRLEKDLDASKRERGDLKNKFEEAEKEIQQLKQSLSESRSQSTNTAEEETHKLRDENKTLNDTLDQKRNVIRELEAEKKRLETEVGKYLVQQGENAADEEIQKLNGLIKNLQDMCSMKDTTIEELKKNMKEIEEHRDKLLSASSEGKLEREKTGIEMKKMEEEINGLKKTHEELQEKLRSTEAKVTEEKKRNEELEKNIGELKTSVKTAQEESAGYQREISSLRSQGPTETQPQGAQNAEEYEKLKKILIEKDGELTKLTAQVAKLKQDKAELETTIGELRKELSTLSVSSGSGQEQKLKEEVETLKARLSKMAGAQLLDDNPNIADLSDPNRAMKLGERYSELYDNQWTDAYEELEANGKEEEESIANLLDILQRVSKICEQLSSNQMKQLEKTVLTLPGTKGNLVNDAKIHVTKKRQLKELRKTFSPDTVASAIELCKQELKMNFDGKPQEEKYFQACVELCWYMNAQDPPVTFMATPKRGDKFDGDSYKSYTQSGVSVDFVVWPTMLLHENGPILSKGVLQGK